VRGEARDVAAPELLVHELRFHQLELEMQNRELREAQSRLEASRARYQELYDQAPVGYVTLDPRGCIAEINLTGAALLGRERETMIGAPLAAVAAFRDSNAFFRHIQSVFRDGRRAQIDLELVGSTGLLTAQFTSSPRVAEEGAVLQCLTTMIDVSDRRRIEDEKQSLLEREQRVRSSAEAANRMKDQFLGIVSHELRTPLTALLGWTRILRLRPQEPALAARGLEVMQRNGESLARIVDDLLDVSRIISGKLSIEMTKFDLEPAVRGSLDLLRDAAAAKGITVTESVAVDCITTGDSERLQQVIWNLLSNAIKFTPAGGHIAVTLERLASAARLTVQDDGRGIDPETLPHVFERFRQADSSSTRQHGGLGLGLAIARHIVEAHGGRIRAESEGKGRGATFTVDLPLRPPSIHPPPFRAIPASEKAEPSRLQNTKILIVDDDVDALEMMAEVLALWGATVKTAASARAALEIIASFLPDALVSDLSMPEESGLDLVARLRALQPPLSQIPAIAVSAHTREEDVREALDGGFTRHLGKPIDLETLAETISAVVGGGATRP
jgi:PAS domain S-box-containing protein